MDLMIMIMRACIYLLFPLYLRNLLFPWMLTKMLLTIFLKIPHNVIEVMVVLMVLLFALKLVESGVHHTCGWGHGIACTPHSPHYIEPTTKYFKKGAGLNGTQVLEGVCWERACDLFQDGLQLLCKKEAKVKKLQTKMFFYFINENLNWDILTKNLVIFKRWDADKDEKFWI